MNISHNAERERFETEVDGQYAVLDYRREGDVIVLSHTEVPAAAEGNGIGSALARQALEYAREQKLRVDPRCPFVRAYVDEHPEYSNLLRER